MTWTRLSATTAVLTLVAALLTLTAAPAQAQGFPLQCRGGGAVQVRFELVARTITIRFQPGPGPAGAGLAPGQCSWHDRALRPGEPWAVCHRNITHFNAYWGPEVFTVQSNDAFWYLGYILSPSAYLNFTVTNEGSCLRLV